MQEVDVNLTIISKKIVIFGVLVFLGIVISTFMLLHFGLMGSFLITIQQEIPYLIQKAIDESITIAVAVLIIDRLLRWRELRDWHESKFLFILQADTAVDKIILAWKQWLITVNNEIQEQELEPEDISTLKGLNCDLAVDASLSTHRLEGFIGKPVGSELDQYIFFKDSEDKNLREVLVLYLAKKRLAYSHHSYSKLYEDIAQPLRKLTDLVDKFSTLVDPKLAAPIIRLSIESENIQSKVYENALKDRKPGIWEIVTAGMVAEAVINSLQLKRYTAYEKLKG